MQIIIDSYHNHYDFFRMNIGQYPYSRGYHYYFDLSGFERDSQNKSYVRDTSNSFESTFSKDQKYYGETKLKDIINR
jgi:hypothetical protein